MQLSNVHVTRPFFAPTNKKRSGKARLTIVIIIYSVSHGRDLIENSYLNSIKRITNKHADSSWIDKKRMEQ